VVVSTEPGTGSLKLGQPVPLSNFSVDSNSGWPQPAHEKVPGALLVQQRAASRPLGAVVAHHLILLGRQHGPPFGVGAGDRKDVILHGRYSFVPHI
jgi:hypothetical protein